MDDRKKPAIPEEDHAALLHSGAARDNAGPEAGPSTPSPPATPLPSASPEMAAFRMAYHQHPRTGSGGSAPRRQPERRHPRDECGLSRLWTRSRACQLPSMWPSGRRCHQRYCQRQPCRAGHGARERRCRDYDMDTEGSIYNIVHNQD